MDNGKLEKLVENGCSQRQIAKEFDCSQSKIKYWLKKLNLKTNNNQYNKGKHLDKNKKYCPKCDAVKPISEFYVRTNRNDITSYCKKCSNEYHTKRVKEVKLKMVNYKGGQCNDCGLTIEDSHYNVFDFHHLNPNEKGLNFDRIKYQKWDKIKIELDKCVLLCANCHRLRHAKEEGW